MGGGPVERRPGRPDGLGGQHDGGVAAGGGERAEDVRRFRAEEFGPGVAELDGGPGPGGVQGGLPGADEPGYVGALRPYEEEEGTAAGEAPRVGGHEQ